MEPEIVETEHKGMVKRATLYQQLQKYAPKALEKLVESLDSKNENIRLGALKIIYDRLVPTLKSIELNGGVDEHGNRQPIQLFVNTGRGFVPATVVLPSSPASGSIGGQPQIQGTSLASSSKEDNNSDIGDNQASTS